MQSLRILTCAATTAALLAGTAPLSAQDQVKMTIGQRGNWDTAVAHLGDKAGIFKKHGIELEMVYTSGSGETLQPVVSGSVDLGIAVGTLGAIAAYAKGAPVRIVAAEATGAADYWYVKATSPIKTLKDTDGKTLAFSTQGSSTHSMVLAFVKEFGLKAKPQSTGNPSATLTAVMTDQVDVGWAAPPFGLKEIDEGKIRLVAKATDASIGTLLAETKLSNRGVGFLIIQAYSIFDMPRMYAMLIVLFVLAIGANALVARIGGLDSIRQA